MLRFYESRAIVLVGRAESACILKVIMLLKRRTHDVCDMKGFSYGTQNKSKTFFFRHEHLEYFTILRLFMMFYHVRN